MSADFINDNMPKYTHESKPHSNANNQVCVLIGHSIEAVTSAVVLASLGQRVHLYANEELLTQQIQQYGFEHHLQALWQLYVQQQYIISYSLPDTADELIKRYEVVSHIDSHASNESRTIDKQKIVEAQKTVALKSLRDFSIPLPPLAIQQEIVAEIESHEKRIDELKQEIAENEAKIKTAINRVWGKATKPVVDETAHR